MVQAETSEGTITFTKKCRFHEAICKCSAITPYGRMESTIKPIVEGEDIYWMNLVSSSIDRDKL